MSFDLTHFSRRLLRLREAKGLSQEQLANASGITRRYVILMEKGKVNFGVEKLAAYLSALDINLSEIIHDSQML